MNDFDFFVGTWDVTNRRLGEHFAGSDDWDTFPATSVCRRVWDGRASFEEMTCPTKGFSGLTLRLHDPVRDEWSLYWANSRNGLLDNVPVVGRFAPDGVGTFYGDDLDDRRPVRVRFVWDEITATTARWTQAFSADDEKTWETNWIMEFTRTG